MIVQTDVLARTLKEAGFSLTASREAIFIALQGHEPMTMHELVAACASQTDRASIYRTVALFEKLGILQRLQIGWKYKLELSDTFIHHHHHCSCVFCGKLIPLGEDSLLENRLRELAQTAGFLPKDHQIEIRGFCQACQNK